MNENQQPMDNKEPAEDPVDVVFRLTKEQIDTALKRVMQSNDKATGKGRPATKKEKQ